MPSAGPVNVCSGSDLYFAEGAGLLCLLFGGGEGESLSVSFGLHPLPILMVCKIKKNKGVLFFFL